MTDASRTDLPWWVGAADAATTLLLTLLGCTVFVTGGFRENIAGVIISITSAPRIFAVAFLPGRVRHVACRRRNLWRRVLDVARRTMHDAPLPDDDLRAALAPAWPVSPAELAAVIGALTVLTLAMTYPQVTRLDGVADLGDPIFSTWRLAWIAHQLSRDPLHLFDANIFAPHANALAYSDPLLLPGFVAAPFIWLGGRSWSTRCCS
jgi:hypothetical protein